MTKEQISSLARHVISIIAGILVARGIADSSIVQGAVGVLASLGSIYWSIREKTYTLGQIEGAIRQILTFASGFLALKGYLNPDNIELWVATIGAILPAILGQTDKLWSDNSVPKIESLK